MSDETAIKSLHTVYVELTAIPLNLTIPRMDAYAAFLQAGFTESDLRLVILARIRQAKEMGKQPFLTFRSLIEDLDRFEEESKTAKAHRRHRQYVHDKASVLRATGREDSPKLPQPQQVGDVLRGKEALAQLQKLRDSL